MKRLYYTLSTQTSVILKDNFRRKNLFDLFGIKHNFDDVSTVAETCNAHGVNPILLLHLCNINTFDDYSPEDDIASEFPVNPAIDYAIKAHHYLKDIIIVQVKEKFNEINSIRKDRVFAELFVAALEAMDEHISNCQKVFAYYRNQHKPVSKQQKEHVTLLESKACHGLEVLIKYMMNMQSSEEYKGNVDYLKYFLISLRKDFDKNNIIYKMIFKRISDI